MVGHHAVDGAVGQRLPQEVLVGGLADRRAALELPGAVRDFLGGEGEVVRAGLDGERGRPPPWRPRSAAARRQEDRCRTCTRAPGASPGAMSRRDRRVLGVARAGGQEVGVLGPPCCGAASRSVRGPRRARSAARRRRRSRPGTRASRPGRAAGTRPLRTATGSLEAEDTGVVQRAQVLDVVGQGAAPEADVDVRLVGGDVLLRGGASTVVVGGRQLSGMSTRVVMPPAAAARVAVQKPSHSVRPGSLTCTWVSTRPGSRTWSPRSSRRAPAGTSASYAQDGGDRAGGDRDRGGRAFPRG